jgi:hypothetical protein
MKGVYMAGILLLPEEVTLEGETVIITRELAPNDENSTINISGDHALYIFNIGDPRRYAAMVKSRSASELLNISVDAPCYLVGIEPIYRARVRCRGKGYWGGWK